MTKKKAIKIAIIGKGGVRILSFFDCYQLKYSMDRLN